MMVKDFLVWNRFSLCHDCFVMIPIDQVIRIGDDAWLGATVVNCSEQLVLMLPSAAEIDFYLFFPFLFLWLEWNET